MRLIDAEPWAESIQKDFCDGCDNYGGVRCSCCKVEDILVALEEVPTIEAKPVVHAHWEKQNYIDMYYTEVHCSSCGKRILAEHQKEYKYCPICGAQMDEKESDNNVGSKTEGVKIPVISMEDVPKLAKEMENNV